MGPPAAAAATPYAAMPGYAGYEPAYGAMPYPYISAGRAMLQPAMAMPYPMMAPGQSGRGVSRVVYYPEPYPVPAGQAYAAPSGAYAPRPRLRRPWRPASTVDRAAMASRCRRWSNGLRSALRGRSPSAAGRRSRRAGRRRVAADRTRCWPRRPQGWSVDGWAMLRPPARGRVPARRVGRGAQPGAGLGRLAGGSQAGMRISWRALSSIGLHLRASTALIPKGRSARS